MNSISAPKRAISLVLAFVLACTMLPSSSIAYAASADASASDQQNEEGAQNAGSETADASPAEGGESAANAASLADSAAGDSAGDSAEQASADSQTAAPAITTGTVNVGSDVDMLQASVRLDAGAATLLTYGGLSYAVNSDDPATVALVGWSGTAPQGTLQVPAQVTDGAATYAVTNICPMGGGVQRIYC